MDFFQISNLVGLPVKTAYRDIACIFCLNHMDKDHYGLLCALVEQVLVLVVPVLALSRLQLRARNSF
jgi:hypothetical protein